MRVTIAVSIFIVGVLANPLVGTALTWKTVQRLCIVDAVVPPPPIRIPVGCELIDCCPGCPGPGPLEWRLRLDAQVLEAAELRFDGLDTANLAQLKIVGNAKLDRDRIIIRPGNSRITGLPAVVAGRVPVASVQPMVDKDAAAKLPTLLARVQVKRGDPDAGTLRQSIAVQQFLGQFEVNSFSAVYLIRRCLVGPKSPPPSVEDQIHVQNIADGDNVVVIMDARTAAGTGGCNNDRVLRTTGATDVGNNLAAAGCNSEVAVFATNNSMLLQSPVTTWSNAAGDIHNAPLQPIINVPISVWIANPAAAAQAPNDVANANLLYSQNKIGVQFVATYNDVSGNTAAVTMIGTAECGAIAAIQGSAFYTANALNVYYVNGTFTGDNCARFGDANITYMGTIANIATLAHEMGHAFGLRPAASGGHTNGVAGFGDNNIMWGGGPPTRNVFSLGQAFRMNTHDPPAPAIGTMLIKNGLRPGTGRECAPDAITTLCPALGLDWARP